MAERADDADTVVAFDLAAQQRLFEALVATVLEHSTELTDLDRAIGDGDHGINLTRGFKAVALQMNDLAGMPIGPALKEIGKRLVMSVGGASGPLYGTLFMALGERLSGPEPISYDRIATAFDGAVAAVCARGKSKAGQKTMLDVLLPVLAELRSGGDRMLLRLAEKAHAAAVATIPMLAQRGRASFLGERSIGHMDPGARSSELLIAAACASLQPSARDPQ